MLKNVEEGITESGKTLQTDELMQRNKDIFQNWATVWEGSMRRISGEERGCGRRQSRSPWPRGEAEARGGRAQAAAGGEGGVGPHSLREKCILSLTILRSGLSRLRIWASTFTVCSLLSPVFLVWNFFSRSLVVMGFRVR